VRALPRTMGHVPSQLPSTHQSQDMHTSLRGSRQLAVMLPTAVKAHQVSLQVHCRPPCPSQRPATTSNSSSMPAISVMSTAQPCFGTTAYHHLPQQLSTRIAGEHVASESSSLSSTPNRRQLLSAAAAAAVLPALLEAWPTAAAAADAAPEVSSSCRLNNLAISIMS